MGSVNSPTSSSSSCASIASFDDISVKSGGAAVKFLCSYGGRILPRYPDAKLRYVGGDIRVLSVSRCITFSDLITKMSELCGWPAVSLRCQMPTEDLDALVSITSDEDLANLIEEYDLANCAKIRAFLHQPVDSKGKGVSRSPIPTQQQQQHRCVHQYSPGASARLFAGVGRSGNGSQRIHHQYHHQHPIHHGNRHLQ